MPKPHQSFYRKYEALILGGSAVIVAITLWEAAWRAGWISPLFFSGPSEIVNEFGIALEGTLLEDMAYSGKNFVAGFFLATVAGVALGIVTGWYRVVRFILDPFLTSLFTMPRVAMIPLTILWFGPGPKAQVFIIFLAAFFPILVNTAAGVRSLDADLLRAARAYCASDWQIFKTIALPGAVPFILTGIRQGVALGLIGVVVGEYFGGGRGIGGIASISAQTFMTPMLFVAIVIIAFTGITLTALAERLERRFSRWRPRR